MHEAPRKRSKRLANLVIEFELQSAHRAHVGTLREQLFRNARRFREQMTKAGFDLLPGEHPIIPIMIYDARKAGEMAAALMEEGVYVTAFSYPVVPKEKARIRTQMCAAHTDEQVDEAVTAFVKVGKAIGVI